MTATPASGAAVPLRCPDRAQNRYNPPWAISFSSDHDLSVRRGTPLQAAARPPGYHGTRAGAGRVVLSVTYHAATERVESHTGPGRAAGPPQTGATRLRSRCSRA